MTLNCERVCEDNTMPRDLARVLALVNQCHVTDVQGTVVGPQLYASPATLGTEDAGAVTDDACTVFPYNLVSCT